MSFISVRNFHEPAYECVSVDRCTCVGGGSAELFPMPAWWDSAELCFIYIHLYTIIYHYQFTSSLNENNIISSKYRARYFVIAIID